MSLDHPDLIEEYRTIIFNPLIFKRRIAMKKILLGGVKLYKGIVSPYKGNVKCKFYPTCSDYAMEAVEKYGSKKGSLMAMKRFLRCNPFSKGGFDPVP